MTTGQTSTPDPDATPTAIWWLDDRDSATQRGDRPDADTLATVPDPASRFFSRLSQRLVLTYTCVGDVVVDLHGDAHMREATERRGRVYVQVPDRAAIADLDRRPATPTSLIVVSRPSTPNPPPPATVNDLFLACRLMMTADVATLALIQPAHLHQQAAPHHWEDLPAAATSAGLHAAGSIIAVHQPGGPDRFLFYADVTDAVAAPTTGTPTAHPAIRIDLFTTTAGDKRHA